MPVTNSNPQGISASGVDCDAFSRSFPPMWDDIDPDIESFSPSVVDIPRIIALKSQNRREGAHEEKSSRLSSDLQRLWARQSGDFWAGAGWTRKEGDWKRAAAGWRPQAEDTCPDDEVLLVCWNRRLLAVTIREPDGFSDGQGGVLPVPPGLDCQWRPLPGLGLAPLGGFESNLAILELVCAAPAFLVRFNRSMPPVFCRVADSPADGVMPLTELRMFASQEISSRDLVVPWDSVKSALLLPEPPDGGRKDEV